VIALLAGRELADADGVGVGPGDALPGVADADGAGVEAGGALPATADAEGKDGSEGTPGVVGTGVADGVDTGAPAACSVQLVPSQVQVSPIASPAVEVDPASSPPKSTTWPVEASYASAGSERGAGAPADGACTQPAAGLVETQSAPVESRPTTSPAAVSLTGGVWK
jgi:hypothetical protein